MGNDYGYWVMPGNSWCSHWDYDCINDCPIRIRVSVC